MEAFTIWSGYAFERMCQQHILQIKRAPGISGIATRQAAWRTTATGNGEQGTQIDLVIDRSDQSINLCEMKFSSGPFVPDKRYAEKLQQREQLFRMETKTRKALFTTLIAPFGLADNGYKTGYVHSTITLNSLFE